MANQLMRPSIVIDLEALRCIHIKFGFAINNQQYNLLHLLFEGTACTESNLISMFKVRQKQSITPPKINRFRWSLKAKVLNIFTKIIFIYSKDQYLSITRYWGFASGRFNYA